MFCVIACDKYLEYILTAINLIDNSFTVNMRDENCNNNPICCQSLSFLHMAGKAVSRMVGKGLEFKNGTRIKSGTWNEMRFVTGIDKGPRTWLTYRSTCNANQLQVRKCELYTLVKWGSGPIPGGTAMPGQPVTRLEQAPKPHPLTKICLISKGTHCPRIRY